MRKRGADRIREPAFAFGYGVAGVAGLTLNWRGCIPRVMTRSSLVLAVLTTVATAHAVAQDRTTTRAEPRPTKNPLEGNAQAISNGGAMFRTRCAGCHGPDARGYIGPDLTGVWLTGNTDDHLFDIVRRGIPGTEMTPTDPLRVIDRDIWQVLAYLRTLSAVTAAPPTGDAANGERLFLANCSRCHKVNGRGGQLGPDLSRIGSGRPRAGLHSKLRGTSDMIRPGYEPVTLVTRDGERIRGVRKNEDEFSIQIMDARERLQGFLKANLTELTMDKQSLMPVYGPERLNDRDLDDLLRYLGGLRGTEAVRR
jgi:cytochrome c oxidase cbb3-type subunit 3